MARPALTAVPAQRSTLPDLKVRRRLVLGALIGAAACGVFSTVAWLTAPDPPAQVTQARDEEAIALATLVVHDYLAGRDTRVPVAEGVSGAFSQNGSAWPEAQVTFAGSVQYRLGDVPGEVVTTERVTFHVRAGEQLLEVSVPMVRSGGGWLLGAAPSLSPLQVPAAGGGGLDYSELYTNGGTASELTTITWGPAIVEQVQRWAHAYASTGANSSELFELTQDTDPTHSYTGLGGWDVQSARIVSYTAGLNTGDRVARFGSTWVTVRVSLVLVPPGANGPTLSADYDLLFEPEVNPARPPVTAWGPAGVGPTSALEDYGNATQG